MDIATHPHMSNDNRIKYKHFVTILCGTNLGIDNSDKRSALIEQTTTRTLNFQKWRDAVLILSKYFCGLV